MALLSLFPPSRRWGRARLRLLPVANMLYIVVEQDGYRGNTDGREAIATAWAVAAKKTGGPSESSLSYQFFATVALTNFHKSALNKIPF